RFVVAGVGTRTVTGAVLRLQSDAPSGAASDSGGSVRSISNRTWVESKVTYNTRPAVDGPVLATAGAVAAGQSVDFDVGAAVHGRGSTFTRSTLQVGTHTIRAAVTDAGGHPGEATIGIRVRGPNLPPRVIIGAPPRDGTVPAGSRVTLSATAVDDFDGDLGSR